jgi:RNA polymerase sigma factor (sigma-70 family)
MPDSPSDSPLEPLPYVPGSTTVWNSSWRRIYDHFAEAIVAFARRQGLNEHSAEDVLQEVMITLIRCQHGQAAGYDRSGGSFQAWLWGVIRNRVRSVRRKDAKEEPLSSTADEGADTRPGTPEIPQPAPDFEHREEEQWQKALLTGALEKVRGRVTPENFVIYMALMREETSPEELAAKHRKETNNIYAIKHRCDKMLLEEAQALRQAWEQLRQPAVK